jgi:hypothetical protein
MPLLQRSFARADPSQKCLAIVQNSVGEEHIGATTFADTVGCIRQLMQLSTFATEIFADLAMLSNGLNTRLSSLSVRATKLQQELPKLVVDDSAFRLDDDEYQHHRQMLQNPQSEHLVDHTTLPPSLEARYCSAEVKRRIQFQTLNAYTEYFAMGNKNTTIAQRYSNPEYFLHQWCTAQVERMKQLERERKQHKADKASRKKARGAETAPKSKRKSSVKWQER